MIRANLLFLVCAHCQRGIAIGRRGLYEYRLPVFPADVDNFYKDHELCGDTRDHFVIGYETPPDSQELGGSIETQVDIPEESLN